MYESNGHAMVGGIREEDQKLVLPSKADSDAGTSLNCGEIGYLSRAYAVSLRHVGEPLELRRAGTWLVQRSIPNSRLFDAMGCYPLLLCRDWPALEHDLEDLSELLVSVVAVADPFGDHGGAACLSKAFPDVVRPLKEHFVVDLSCSPDRFISAHHRYKARRGLAALQVMEIANPLDALEDWSTLYSALSKRHRLAGVTAFPRESFRLQLGIRGLIAWRAEVDGATAGMTLWYRHGERAYFHLGAYNKIGYAQGAAYALFRTAIDSFAAQGVRWLDLGGGAGTSVAEENDGLVRFKRGWSTGRRTAYLCGRILNRRFYSEICETCRANSNDYFPAYRQPGLLPSEVPRVGSITVEMS